MIEVKNLSKSYGESEVLKDINFEVKKGEIFALVGHSGAGKSTLLRCMNGLESYQGGSLKIKDVEMSSISGYKLREFRKNVGMIFQHFALMSRKTVYENVAIPLIFWKYDKEHIKKRVYELLDIVGLKHRANAYPNELSGGQKQRVAIARALALNPEILLSDEATSALDPSTTKSILELLNKINKELGITIVIVTHEMEVVKSIAHRAILLVDGKIVNNGKIDELFLQPDKNMREFLGEEEILPQNGVNIRLCFPKSVAFNPVITDMARKLNIDFNIVWGRIEKLGEDVLGILVVNIDERYLEEVKKYLKESGVIWEIVEWEQ